MFREPFRLYFKLLFLSILCSILSISILFSQERYVVLSPELGEIIAALGRLNRVVGVTKECDYPKEYSSIDKVGNFGSVNYEKVISKKPTLVFTSDLEHLQLNNNLSKMNIPIASFYPKSFSELMQTILSIGQITDSKTRARTIVDSMKRAIAELKSTQKPRVYIEIYPKPIMSAAQTSFLGDLIHIAGGVNIFFDLKRDYSRVKSSQIIAKNPQVIILTYDGVDKENIADRLGWREIDAVQRDAVFTTSDINPDIILRASPRSTMGIVQLNEIFAATLVDKR